MKPFTNLNLILRDRCSFQSNLPFQGLQNVTISLHQIGELCLTSGKLIACDPLIEADLRYYFVRSLAPGYYPIILSVADFHQLGDSRLACAMVCLSKEPTVRWEAAVINEQHSQQGELYGYSVDSGTGCFMDLDAAQSLKALSNPDPVEYEAVRKVSYELAWDLSLKALDRFEQEFCDRILAEMKKNQVGNFPGVGWANVRVSDEPEANVITFSSGWGDGGYASFWGYDASGNLTSLVTDFALFGSE